MTLHEKYNKAIGKFVFIRYKLVETDKIILKYGILTDIFEDSIRITHKNNSEMFWDIPASRIIEFSCEEVKE